MRRLILGGVALVFLGFMVIIAGILLGAKSTDISVRGGGVVFLGPIPLVFGTDRNSAVVVALMVTVSMVLFYLFFRR